MVWATQARRSAFRRPPFPPFRRNKEPGQEFLRPRHGGWGGIRTDLGREKRPQQGALGSPLLPEIRRPKERLLKY